MLTLRAGDGRIAIAPDDRSIQVHVCHGPMREVEVLYDQLLWLFEQHPDLTPADVVVMTPDIDAYAPAIEAVFGGAAGPRRIPFTIADRSLRADSPLVEAFLGLLDLPDSRYDADRLLTLLEAPAVHRRFGIASGDLDLVQRLVTESAVRWGVDAASRARLGLPAVAEHTWRFGLDRLLLGFSVPSGDARLLEGVLPCDAVEGSDAQVLGHLGAFVEAAASLRESLAAPRGLAAWGASLAEVLDRFVDAAEDDAETVQALRGVLQRLADDAGRAGYDAPVSLALVRVLLRRELEQPINTGRFLTGGVTFCAMVPMRSIPFDVVCLVGMNDGSFPRTRQPVSFDLMADHPERGDRSRRDDDRYLFLEAIVSARRCLYLSYVGRGIRDNAPIPPSIVVSELLDAVRAGIRRRRVPGGDRASAAGRSARATSRAPPSRASSATPPSCARRVACGGCARSRRDASWRGGFRMRPAEEASVDLDGFLRFFANPTARLLQRRLGVRLTEAELPPLRREPFVLDGLGRYVVRNELLARQIRAAGDDPLRALRAGGLLPYGRVGDVELVRQRAVVEEFAERLLTLTGGEALESIALDLQLGALRLEGALHGVARDGVIDHRLAEPKASDQLSLWIRHLVLHVARPRSGGWRSVWLGTRAVVFEPVADARSHLDALAAVYREGMQRLLPFFPKSALAWCEATRAKLDAAHAKWDGNDFVDGESAEAHLLYAWREVDPIGAEFERLARAGDAAAGRTSVRGVLVSAPDVSRPLDLRAVSLEGLQVIEASAGTGKTRTITGIYLRLVMERDIPVEQILVVTYTVAATEELRERIRDVLLQALAALRGSAVTDEMAAELTAAVDDREAATRRVQQALANFDLAAIHTIHGFCQRALADGAFESGLPFDRELVPDVRDLVQEVVDDFWRTRRRRRTGAVRAASARRADHARVAGAGRRARSSRDRT